MGDSDDDFCDGLNQSPVNIQTRRVVKNPTLGQFTFHNFIRPIRRKLKLMVANVIPAPRVWRPGADQEWGMPAPNYILDQLHFHVGAKDSRGSEHSVNRKFFPAEMHMVFHSSDYPGFEEAQNRPQGLAVLGIRFKISRGKNPALQPVINQVCRITRPISNIKYLACQSTVRDE